MGTRLRDAHSRSLPAIMAIRRRPRFRRDVLAPASPGFSAACWESGRMELSEPAQLALDTILGRTARGIPGWMLHIMNHAHIERIARVPAGTYRACPDETYIAAQRALGTCMLDQFLGTNPLTMTNEGFDEALGAAPPSLQSLPYTPVDVATGRVERDANGQRTIVLNDLRIDSPEAVVEHLERFVFPRIQRDIAGFDEERRVTQIVERERAVQGMLGPDILKTGYSFVFFPYLYYGQYGYEQYFAAYAAYPEVLERHFKLQADYALLNNRAAARAYAEARLPPYFRLDHDMAASRGMLVSIKSLDRLWFPHFVRCLQPLLAMDVRLIWHCDGNLMQMAPRLLEVGIRGFQGFQYEDGMDYERICRMKTRAGEDLLILAGVSVTSTLPFGTTVDVKRQLDWLVEMGPRTGLFLGASSTITPETPWENLRTLIEGLQHYRQGGRQ